MASPNSLICSATFQQIQNVSSLLPYPLIQQYFMKQALFSVTKILWNLENLLSINRDQIHPNFWLSTFCQKTKQGISLAIVYSVRGLERSELGGSHGCPERLWDRFLWQVYHNDSRHDALDAVWTCHKNWSQRRPGQPWDPPNSLRPKSLGQSTYSTKQSLYEIREQQNRQ